MALVVIEGALYLKQPRELRDANARVLRKTSKGRVWCNALMTPVILASALPALHELMGAGTGAYVGAGVLIGVLLLMTIVSTVMIVGLMLGSIVIDWILLNSERQPEG